MKWGVVILSGAADEPLPELDGLTPLEVADTPNIDRLARMGRVGAVAAIPRGAPADPALGAMSLLGCDAALHWPGRSAIEAAAAGLDTPADASLFVVDLVCAGCEGSALAQEDTGIVLDAAPADLMLTETRELFAAVIDSWRDAMGDSAASLSLASVAPGRGVLIDTGNLLDWDAITRPPSAVRGRDWRQHTPRGRCRDVALALMETAAQTLEHHDVNLARISAGVRPANLAWLWGPGQSAALPPLAEMVRVRALAAGRDSAFLGAVTLLGVKRAPITASTSADPIASTADAAVDVLSRADMVFAHTSAAATAAADADIRAKIAAIERADDAVVGPMLDALLALCGEDLEPRGSGAAGWRLLVCCDCAYSCRARTWIPEPTPFVMGGAWVRSLVQRRFTEAHGKESLLFVRPGCDLLEYFLASGLKGISPIRKKRTST